MIQLRGRYEELSRSNRVMLERSLVVQYCGGVFGRREVMTLYGFDFFVG